MASAILDLESSYTIHCTHPYCDYPNQPSFSWPYPLIQRSNSTTITGTQLEPWYPLRTPSALSNDVCSGVAHRVVPPLKYKSDCWIVGRTGRKKLSKSAWLAYNAARQLLVAQGNE